jgi:S-adenosylmethionine:tRNA ribosyltransferase-isomerase
MKTKEFDYSLPFNLIAQEPLAHRDTSRLLALNRQDNSLKEALFKDIINFLNKGDVLVLNKSKVIPARLWASKKTGAKIEILLLEEKDKGLWEVLFRPSKRIKFKEELLFADTEYKAEALERKPSGKWLVRFSPSDITKLIYQKGVIPTPPYIKTELKDPASYQTVFAKDSGSIAAPTAGLHFTKDLLARVKSSGVDIVYITLHVGLGTFRPINTEDIENHCMDSEYYQIEDGAASVINKVKKEKRRVFACGTSVVRALESAAQGCEAHQLKSGRGKTGLFIYPGYAFKMVDALITNFHVPKSTNLLLVSSFAGKDFISRAYQHAINENFRFYSFGDAMLVL